MSVEALPLSMKCNLACSYCYEDPMRAREGQPPRFDFGKMAKQLRIEVASGRKGDGFTVFGGEPLLLSLDDLEKFLALSFELSGKSGVQTNGALIREHHFPLFEKYRTHVGISMDGPGELNAARAVAGAGLEATAAATEASELALRLCLARGVSTSLIVTLHKLNAVGRQLEQLAAWLTDLAGLGLRNARIHTLEVDGAAAVPLILSTEEAVRAFRRMHRLETATGLAFDVFADMFALLRGRDGDVTCTWNACDPAYTAAVRGVGPLGESLNCGRTNKDGVSWLKADRANYHRQATLYATPQADGGCKDCRFFVACKGQCPGEAIDGDPRNRSSHCDTWFALFSFLESRMVEVRELPVSLRPDLRTIEAEMLGEMEEGRFCSVEKAIARAEASCSEVQHHSSIHVHGDSGHGDEHGDHTDTGGRS